MGIRTCRELLALEYGSELQTRIVETTFNVTTSGTTLAKGNGARIWISIFNNINGLPLTVSTNSSPTTFQGIVILANDFRTFYWKRDGDLPTLAFYGIVGGDAGPVTVIEQILTGSGN
jgi:hypothetical protein